MGTRLTAKDLQDRLGLVPLPGEGGLYAEVHRSAERIGRAGLPKRFPGDRALCTVIYYMLPGDAKSLLHRIKGEELWHFLMGDPFTLVEIAPDGAALSVTVDLIGPMRLVPSGPHEFVAEDRPATFRLRMPPDGSSDRFEFDWGEVRSYARRAQD